jgi:hypothetical protein
MIYSSKAYRKVHTMELSVLLQQTQIHCQHEQSRFYYTITSTHAAAMCVAACISTLRLVILLLTYLTGVYKKALKIMCTQISKPAQVGAAVSSFKSAVHDPACSIVF